MKARYGAVNTERNLNGWFAQCLRSQRAGVAVLLLVASAATCFGADATSPGIGLLELQPLAGISQDEAKMVTGELAKALQRAGDYKIQALSDADVKGLFASHGESLPTALDVHARARIGDWLGGTYAISGTVGKVGQWNYLISLDIVDVHSATQLTTVSLKILDYTQKLVVDRLARLVLWTRVKVDCNIPDRTVSIDDIPYRDDQKDAEYGVWLVKPGLHTVVISTSRPNYSSYKEQQSFGVAEEKTIKASLNNLAGLLEVKTPSPVNVYLGDALLAHTAYIVRELPAGSYKVTLAAPHRVSAEHQVTIVTGKKTTVDDALAVNLGSYRTPAIVTLSLAAAFTCGGGVVLWQASEAYDRYIETMDRAEMTRQLNRARTLDKVSYGCFGAGGVFAIWSAAEWLALAANAGQPEKRSWLRDRLQFGYSPESSAWRLGVQVAVERRRP